jgi:hypothetical protein
MRNFIDSAIYEIFLINSRSMKKSETPIGRNHFKYLSVDERII